MQQTPDQLFLADDNLSYWARGLYAQAMDRDPVDASNDVGSQNSCKNATIQINNLINHSENQFGKILRMVEKNLTA